MEDKKNETVKTEAARVYSDMSKEKIESIWKRRDVAWKTNFVLWTGLVAVSAVLYKEAGNLPDSMYYWTLGAFIVIFIAHSWHWIGAYVSDEIGYSWAHYYQEQGELCLHPDLSKIVKHRRPSNEQGWYYHLYQKYDSSKDVIKKLHAIIPQIFVTAALMAVVLFLLHEKLPGKTGSHASPNCNPVQLSVVRPVDVNEPNSIRK